MSFFLGSPGTVRVAADGVLISSGKPVRIFDMNIVCGAGGNGVVLLRSGTAGTGTVWVKETGVASTGKTVNFGEVGIRFPSGCYVDIDANVASVAMTAILEK